MTKNMRIGIAGDWHGNTAWAVDRLHDFKVAGISLILQLGDFGIWHDEQGTLFLSSLNDTAGKNGQKILVTLGNHENYTMVGALTPITEGEFAGWEHNPELPNILYATRGQRWEWAGVSFVSLGGAHSIDRKGRQENMNWWAGEQISMGDIMRTAAGGYADIFLAHDCPAGVELFDNHRSDDKWDAEALEYAQKSRDDLRAAVDEVKPELLFHGHYHHYIDRHTDLTDFDGVVYNLHTIGLDKDDESNNIGILTLPSKEFTILK